MVSVKQKKSPYCGLVDKKQTKISFPSVRLKVRSTEPPTLQVDDNVTCTTTKKEPDISSNFVLPFGTYDVAYLVENYKSYALTMSK